ncbi:hypothetical protein U9K52_12595 [Chryseobacterium sp. MHB01]|uniref:hypothetical protein n=1 Tax=Chryseobacterium sp. MHB01 TaxID=3109433 RepID=UPI002AFE0518|nr:hypothetical protein [Chryseobacterium sp. MHB01]MEA1849755.1 hypothetical protein [Chryseobacterium sp. MHB01]
MINYFIPAGSGIKIPSDVPENLLQAAGSFRSFPKSRCEGTTNFRVFPKSHYRGATAFREKRKLLAAFSLAFPESNLVFQLK